jgi:ABC-type multidrug transport system fused ATPase/permease subunit
VKGLKRLLVEMRPLYPALSVITMLALAGTGLSLVAPWIYREMVNFLTSHQLSRLFGEIIPTQEPMMVLIWLIAMYCGLQFLAEIASALEAYMQNVARSQSFILFSIKTLRKLHTLPVEFFDKRSPGALRERTSAGVNEMFGIARNIVVEIVPVLITFATAMVVLMRFDFKLSLGLIVAAPIYVGLSIWRAKILRFWQKKYRNSMEKSGRIIMENLFHYQLIKEFSRHDYEELRLKKTFDRGLSVIKRQERVLRGIGVIREVVAISANLWVYGYGGYLVLEGKLSIGDLILFVAYLARVFDPLGWLTNIYDQLQVGFVSIGRLFKIWDIKPSVDDVPGAKPLKVVEGAVKFERVSFTYHSSKRQKGERTVFKNFNLNIQPHEVVAIVGPSGVGKSTLTKLLLRLYDPDKGRILIDGQDIARVTQTSLRQNVGTVMQEVAALNNTLQYNLKYGKPRASMPKIIDATKAANLYEFVMSLPNKFKTKIGERGVRLSGGEKQRLAIARALLKDAPILILDEATSALDSENEAMIQEALWKLIKGKTTVIIAHRLSTVKRANRVVVLENGKITEQGTHMALMKRSGYYRRLFTLQGAMLEK